MEMTLGERIRELREDADLSLRELAREVEITAAFMSDIELGKRYPSDDVLKRIAKKLKVALAELAAYDARPPLEELRRKSSSSPAYGFALRRMVEEGVHAEDLMKALDHLKKKR
jgi:transcriptional regulator with XRE-family HTH domain